MTVLQWDQTGQRRYETGVSKGVLFQVDEAGEYVDGVPWNGLTTVTQSPSGAESNKQYADNRVYVNLLSAEEFGGTIEAFTYPPEFEQNDGSLEVAPGVTVSQQTRKPFGFCWQSIVGNDVEANDYGYKIHLVWGAQAAPSEKANATVNESPELVTMSWEVSTTPIEVGLVDGKNIKPTAKMTIDSTTTDPTALATLEGMLYGTVSTAAFLPLPKDVITLVTTGLLTATPTAPSFNSGTHTITIPAVTGVVYKINGVTKPAGAVVITEDTVVRAYPLTGYRFPPVIDDDWFFDFV